MSFAVLLFVTLLQAAVGQESSGKSIASFPVPNCKVTNFKPPYLQGYYEPVANLIWQNTLGIELWYEPYLDCWVMDTDYRNSNGFSQGQLFALRNKYWKAKNCLTGDSTSTTLPPQSGWTESDGRTSFAQGTVVCSHDVGPVQGATTAEREALKKESVVLWSTPMEMGIASLIVFIFFTVISAYRWRRARLLNARLLELAEVNQARLAHAAHSDPTRRSGLLDVQFLGSTECIGGAAERQAKHPQQIALEAVYFMQNQPNGHLTIACPAERHSRRDDSSEAQNANAATECMIVWRHEMGVAEPKNGEQPEECCICMENVPDICHQPCGHACECRICFSQRMVDWKQNTAPCCPLCRAPILCVVLDTTKRYDISVPKKCFSPSPPDVGDYQIRTDIVFSESTARHGPAPARLGPWVEASSSPVIHQGVSQPAGPPPAWMLELQGRAAPHAHASPVELPMQLSEASAYAHNSGGGNVVPSHPSAYSLPQRNSTTATTTSGVSGSRTPDSKELVEPDLPRQLSAMDGAPLERSARWRAPSYAMEGAAVSAVGTPRVGRGEVTVPVTLATGVEVGGGGAVSM